MSPEEILRKAAEIVGGDRHETHGHYARNHQTIALMWTAYLGRHVGADDVARMMALVKIARARTGEEYTPDHDLDAAGYCAIAGALAEGV